IDFVVNLELLARPPVVGHRISQAQPTVPRVTHERLELHIYIVAVKLMQPHSADAVGAGPYRAPTHHRIDIEPWGGRSGGTAVGIASTIESVKEFRPVLEMHRVEVFPFATPNEAILLENLHDLERQAIPVAGTLWPPQPVVGKFRIYINGRAPCMHTARPGVFDGAAVECTGARNDELFELRAQNIKLCGNRAQSVRDAVHGRDLNGAAAGFRQPSYFCKLLLDLALRAVPVHLVEEGCVAEASRILLRAGLLFHWSFGVGNRELIQDRRAAQLFLEALGAETVGDWHAGSILPDHDLFVLTCEEVRIGAH